MTSPLLLWLKDKTPGARELCYKFVELAKSEGRKLEDLTGEKLEPEVKKAEKEKKK